MSDDATETRIRQRAFELWESEGRPYGRSAYYWLLAEEEILRGDEPSKAAQGEGSSERLSHRRRQAVRGHPVGLTPAMGRPKKPRSPGGGQARRSTVRDEGHRGAPHSVRRDGAGPSQAAGSVVRSAFTRMTAATRRPIAADRREPRSWNGDLTMRRRGLVDEAFASA